MGVVIQVACLWSCTSIFTRQMIVVADFFICWSSSWWHCCIPSIVFVYCPGVLQSIFHHCISRRCSFHMVHVASIGWWRILMAMVHMSLVYVERFRNMRRWQKVSTLLFCFCKLDFVTPLLVASFWKLDSLCSV